MAVVIHFEDSKGSTQIEFYDCRDISQVGLTDDIVGTHIKRIGIQETFDAAWWEADNVIPIGSNAVSDALSQFDNSLVASNLPDTGAIWVKRETPAQQATESKNNSEHDDVEDDAEDSDSSRYDRTLCRK